MLFSVKADAFGSAAKQFKQHGGSFPVTIKTKPHGCAMRRGRGGDRKAPSSLPQERNPLRNKKVQLVLTPKSNEIKRNQMKSNFLDEHPFPVLQYHCRNSDPQNPKGMTQMCNVNYLIEIRRFNTFAARTRLPASAQLLWYKLIEIMNQHARGGDWCDGFLRIDNPYLLAYFPMSVTALADARRMLCEAGLLEYIPGEKKRTPPAYRLHYFSVCDGKGAIERDYPREISADSTADCPADAPEIRDYSRDNPNYPSVYPSDCTTVCPTDCTTDCTTDCHGNTPDFHDTNINYTETETETVNPTGKTNDDEKETSASSAGYAGAGACTGAYACTEAGAREGAFPRSVRESAKLAGKVLLHQVFTENQLNRVMAAFNRYPFEDGLMIQAVAKTAEANPTNAVNYLIQLLTDWGGAGVRTVAEMEDYLYARDMAQGNALMHTREEGQALLAAFRAEHGAA